MNGCEWSEPIVQFSFTQRGCSWCPGTATTGDMKPAGSVWGLARDYFRNRLLMLILVLRWVFPLGQARDGQQKSLSAK